MLQFTLSHECLPSSCMVSPPSNSKPISVYPSISLVSISTLTPPLFPHINPLSQFLFTLPKSMFSPFEPTLFSCLSHAVLITTSLSYTVISHLISHPHTKNCPQAFLFQRNCLFFISFILGLDHVPHQHCWD